MDLSKTQKAGKLPPSDEARIKYFMQTFGFIVASADDEEQKLCELIYFCLQAGKLPPACYHLFRFDDVEMVLFFDVKMLRFLLVHKKRSGVLPYKNKQTNERKEINWGLVLGVKKQAKF